MPRFWKLGTILQNNNPYSSGGSGGPTSADLVTIVPAGNITSINVQNAIYELDSKKEPAIVIGTSIQYWRGDKTWQTLDKTAVGLSNVPNLDTSNPVNITQDATHRFTTDTEKATWNAKEDAIIAGTTSQYWRGDKTWQTLDKTSIGLSNVPNLDTSNPANISQDTTHRFVTDNEKATWNADIDVELITQASHGFSNGQAVYLTSGGVFVLADASTDTKLTVGIVTSATLNTFLLMRIGTATVTSHGLSPIGETFYQSQTTPGALTTTKPITGIVSFIGIIKDANTLLIGPIIHSIASTGTLPWGNLTGAIINQTDLTSALSLKQNLIGYTPENITNKSTDVTLSSNSDTFYPSVKAAKTYTDTAISAAVTGLLNDRGDYDASGNGFPSTGGSGPGGSILRGDIWFISVPGTLGGIAVDIGDSVRALVDSPGQTATNWNILHAATGYVPENVANKVTSISSSSTDTQYPSAKLLYDKLVIENNYLGTGVKSGCVLSINADPTKVDISSGTYNIVNNSDPTNPIVSSVIFPGATGVVLDNLATANSTHIGLSSSGTIFQQTASFTPEQRRLYAHIGVAIHSNKTFVNVVNNLPDVALDEIPQFNDFLEAIHNFNIYGNVISANGANLNINKSLGAIFKKGANFTVSNQNPHILTLASLTAPSNLRYRLQNGTEYSNTNAIDPSNYDLNGILTAVPANNFTVQRLTLFSSNLIRIQYGQTYYNSIATAIDGIAKDAFVTEENIADNGLLRCLLVVKSGTTDLSDLTQAVFLEVDRFGGIQSAAASGSSAMWGRIGGTLTNQTDLSTELDNKATKQTPTAVKTSTYTASPGDIVVCDISGGSFTVNLPIAPADKSSLRIKLVSVNTTNRLTIACGGTDVLNKAGGPTVKYLHILNEAALLQYQATTGIWFVLSTDAPLEGFATNFPGIDALTPISASDISINYTTRVLTITPPLGYFYYFTDGGGIITRYIQMGNLSFPAFTDTSGIWYFYLDSNGVATTTQTKWAALDSVCTIYRILWNATLSGSAKATVESFDANQNTLPTVSRIFNERYGTVMAVTTSGGITSNVLASGAPNADGRNAVIGMANINNLYANLAYTITNSTGGLMWQQDLGVTVAGSLNATNSAMFPIRYQDGSGLAYTLPATRFPFDWDSGTNAPNYITATSIRTPVSNNYYFVYYIYAFQDPRNGQGVRSISDIAQYSTAIDAESSTWSNIQSAYPTLNDTAIRPMYRLIYEHRTSYSDGSKQSVLREIQDLRIARITTATVTTGIVLASSVVVTPTGNISSTNVQAAIQELDTEKCAIPIEGTYTPTLSNTTNIAASTAYQCSYSRIGNTVFVWGKLDIDPTAAVATLLGVSLPIASNLGVEGDLGGTASCRSFTQSAGITADITNDSAQFNFIAADVSNRTWDFNFNYRVI